MTVDEPPSNDEDARHVFLEWDRCAKSGDTPGLLDLYTDDAVLETPLIPRLLGVDNGALKGNESIGRFFAEGAARRPNELVRWYRNGSYLWDGRTLMWEYLRAAPDGDQVDICEVMELRGSRIARHRIYWGWFGTEMLIRSALAKS